MTQRTFDVGTRPQLALDHDLFDRMSNVQERLHPVTKHPEPVLKPEAPWEAPGQGALWGPLYAAQDSASGRIRLWYQAYSIYPGRGGDTGDRACCIAESDDGITFERPDLGLKDWQGSRTNNIFMHGRSNPALGDVAHSHGTIDSARIDPSEDPAYRFKAAVWMGRDSEGFGGHGVAFSPDGMRWTPYAHNPVVRFRDAGDVVSCASLRDFVEPENSAAFPSAKYAMFPKMHAQLGRWNRRSFAVCFSDDSAEIPYTRFDDPKLILSPDERDDDMAEDRLAGAREILMYDDPADHRCEFYGVQVFRRGDVFLGLLWVYDTSYELSRLGTGNQLAIVEVQLVASRDCIHWRRVGNRQPVIPRGAPDAFDSHMIFYHALPIAVGDEWWTYYVGFNEGHAARNAYSEEQRERYWAGVTAGSQHLPSVGLGKIRQEGFASLTAGAETGTLITRPLRPGGGQLQLNASVAAGGAIRVEVQDTSGAPLASYGLDACTPIDGDAVRLPVRWGARDGDPGWAQREARLKFSLRDADLFAFAFSDI